MASAAASEPRQYLGNQLPVQEAGSKFIPLKSLAVRIADL